MLLVLVAIATFLPTLSFGFTYDDFYQILYNTVVLPDPLQHSGRKPAADSSVRRCTVA
jgi:hypothetical protein